MISEVIVDAHHWLEYLSWGANAALAVVGIIALFQVHAAITQAKSALAQNKISLDQLNIATAQLELSRQEIVLRSRREALALTFQQCEAFAEKIIPEINEVATKLKELKFQPSHVNGNFDHPEQLPPVTQQIWSDAALRAKIVMLLNHCEAFAMYFANNLADETAAFPPLGATFCESCEFFSVFIGLHRHKDRMKLYVNLVKLYGIWKPRVQHSVLDEQAKLIATQKSNIPQATPQPPLGTKL